MRLFVALWPPPEVANRVAALSRPAHPGLRWTVAEQWHVTLRFLGEVADTSVPALEGALAAVASSSAPRVAALGPETRRLGRAVLVVPVAGVADLADAVAEATGDVGKAPDPRRFDGHVTVARARGRGAIPAALAGQPVTGAWPVGELVLVRSHLGRGGARYEPLRSYRLGG